MNNKTLEIVFYYILNNGMYMKNEIINTYVQNAIKELKNSEPDYYNKCLTQRLFNGIGSTTECDTIEEMEDALFDANWEPWDDINHVVSPDCKAFITHDIPGHYGMINLDQFNPTDIAHFRDPKNTGMLSLCVNTDKRTDVDYTVLITGNENGKDVMYTFHPGDPVPASTFAAGSTETGGSGYQDGDEITIADAIKLGFKRAKAE